MKKQYKYALAGSSFAASAATSIYFGVKGFFPPEPPFQHTKYQQQEGNENKQFIREGADDPEWKKKSDFFSKELSDKSSVENAFKSSDLSKYSSFINGYDKNDEGKIRNFLYSWCRENRASENEEIFNLIGVYCVKGNESRARPKSS